MDAAARAAERTGERPGAFMTTRSTPVHPQALGTVHIADMPEGCERAVEAALGAHNAKERGCWLGEPRAAVTGP